LTQLSGGFVSEQFSTNGYRSFSISAKDVVAIGFRRKRIIVLCFTAISMGAVLLGVFSPSSYQAHTKLLVKRERVDPVITPGQDAPVVMHDDVTEEELNSEVELLESDDVLRQVVIATGLDAHPSLFGRSDEATRIAKAIQRLRSSLQVEAMKKSNLISITYSSSDAQLCTAVLKKLNDTYIEKNTDVHRPHGQYKFFEQQAERYKAELNQAEQQLKQFATEPGGVSPQLARDNTLQKLSEFKASLDQARAEMAATEEKIRTLEKQEATLPGRITTQLREIDDAALLQQYKSTLLNLELKRTELLTKYQPTSRSQTRAPNWPPRKASRYVNRQPMKIPLINTSAPNSRRRRRTTARCKRGWLRLRPLLRLTVHRRNNSSRKVSCTRTWCGTKRLTKKTISST
jgi:uncharacterized protein involved in exopolysaccharide biosynthesis